MLNYKIIRLEGHKDVSKFVFNKKGSLLGLHQMPVSASKLSLVRSNYSGQTDSKTSTIGFICYFFCNSFQFRMPLLASIASEPWFSGEVEEHLLFMKEAMGSIPIKGLTYFHCSFIVLHFISFLKENNPLEG